MKRLTVLNPYIIKLDDNDLNILNENIYNYGLLDAFNKYLNYLDVTRLCNGNRITQTINAGYKRDISLAIKLIEQMESPQMDDAIDGLIERHNKNLEFEKMFGVKIYEKKKPKPVKTISSTSKVRKQKDLFNSDAFVPAKKLFSKGSLIIGK